MDLPTRSDVADLVRAPAVLSAPGDALVGRAASGSSGVLGTVLAGAASAALYAGGMALNDHADRDVDAVERPTRPIPSGRVLAATAFAIGEGLQVAGIALAGASGGRRGAARAAVVSAAVHNYDYVAKRVGGTVAAASMAGCRAADVLLGATSVRAGLPSAAVIGAHTFAITKVSQHEVEGGSPAAARAALAVCGCVTTAALAVTARRARKDPWSALVGAASLVVYAVPFARAARRAAQEPTPANNGAVVGVGVKAMIPLQGALVSGNGRPLEGALVTSLWPLSRRLARKRSVT